MVWFVLGNFARLGRRVPVRASVAGQMRTHYSLTCPFLQIAYGSSRPGGLRPERRPLAYPTAASTTPGAVRAGCATQRCRGREWDWFAAQPRRQHAEVSRLCAPVSCHDPRLDAGRVAPHPLAHSERLPQCIGIPDTR